MKTYKQERSDKVEAKEISRLNMTVIPRGSVWYRLGRYFTPELLEITKEGIGWSGKLHECETVGSNNNQGTLPEKQVTVLERELVDSWEQTTATDGSIAIDLRSPDRI